MKFKESGNYTFDTKKGIMKVKMACFLNLPVPNELLCMWVLCLRIISFIRLYLIKCISKKD